MNKNFKIALAFMALCCVNQMTIGADIYSTQKLNDGTTIQQCRYNNGKIDYCTQKDLENALRAFHNKELTMSKSQIAELKAKEQKLRSIYTFDKELSDKKAELDKEVFALQKKGLIGVDVSEQQLNLLEFQSKVIDELLSAHIVLNSSDSSLNETAMNAEEISDNYESIIYALESKEITQSEYDKVKTNLIEKEKLLRNIYNKVMQLKSAPNEAPFLWVEKHYPGTQEYINSGNALVDILPDKLKDKAKKVQNIKGNFNTGMETVNNLKGLKNKYLGF